MKLSEALRLIEGAKKNLSQKEIIAMINGLKADAALKKRAIDQVKKSKFKIFTGASSDGKSIHVGTKRRDRFLGTIETSFQVK